MQHFLRLRCSSDTDFIESSLKEHTMGPEHPPRAPPPLTLPGLKENANYGDSLYTQLRLSHAISLLHGVA